MILILHIIFGKCQDIQALFGVYLVLTYIERLSRLFFQSVFIGQ